MTKLLKFITYFVISSLIYYLFLVVEAISLYFDEFGFDFANAIRISFSSIESVINFGLFISFILITTDLLKEKIPLAKIFKTSIVISIAFGGIIFFLSNAIVPELRLTSFLDRYENARKKTFSSTERDELRKGNVKMMSIKLINKYSDSLEKANSSNEKVISDLVQKIPDSIIHSNLSKKELTKYSLTKSKVTSDFNRIDLNKLIMEIRKNERFEKRLRISYWEINKRYLNIFLTIFLVCFGITIGQNFKNQRAFSLVCIGIVIFSQSLTLLTTMADYFIDKKNLIGLIFKLIIILTVFLYLIYRMSINKNTGVTNQ